MKDISPALRLCLAALFAVLFALAAVVYLPHVAGWLALLAVCLLFPIPAWQRWLGRVLKRAKPALIAAVCLLVFIVAPTSREVPTPTVPTVPVTSTVATTSTRTTAPQENTYILNRSSKKYHLPTCGSVKQMKEENRLTYTGLESDLLADGYTPCGNCLP